MVGKIPYFAQIKHGWVRRRTQKTTISVFSDKVSAIFVLALIIYRI